MEDFFISYNHADKHWAQGTGDWLDRAGFSTILQATNFVAGSNFVSEMHAAVDQARRIILILSPDYLSAPFPESEWTAVFAKDPTNKDRTLIPVRVRECEPGGLLRPIVYIDLVGLHADQAREKFLTEITAMLQGKRQPDHPSQPRPSASTRRRASPSKVNQTAIGSGITQVAGDQFIYGQPPKKEIVFKPREGAISAEQAFQVQQWIANLADGTVGMSRKSAFKKWYGIFTSTFKIDKYQELLAIDFSRAEAWYRQQSAIGVRKLKSLAPDLWRKERYKAIHTVMGKIGVDKLTYYGEIARRLKMRKAFTSLTQLTKRDLDRVYTLVLRDGRDMLGER